MEKIDKHATNINENQEQQNQQQVLATSFQDLSEGFSDTWKLWFHYTFLHDGQMKMDQKDSMDLTLIKEYFDLNLKSYRFLVKLCEFLNIFNYKIESYQYYQTNRKEKQWGIITPEEFQNLILTIELEEIQTSKSEDQGILLNFKQMFKQNDLKRQDYFREINIEFEFTFQAKGEKIIDIRLYMPEMTINNQNYDDNMNFVNNINQDSQLQGYVDENQRILLTQSIDIRSTNAFQLIREIDTLTLGILFVYDYQSLIYYGKQNNQGQYMDIAGPFKHNFQQQIQQYEQDEQAVIDNFFFC